MKPDTTSRCAKPPVGSRYPSPLALFVLWTFVGGLSYTRHAIQDVPSTHGAHFWAELLGWLACFWPWAVLSPFVIRLEATLALGRGLWLRNGGVLVLLSIPVTLLAFEASGVLHTLIEAAFGVQLGHRDISRWVPPRGEIVLEQFLYWSTVLGACLVRNLMRARENERRATQLALEKSQLENDLRRAELEVLRMRLNPHFLFNTLQNISVLIHQEPRTASQMLSRLGDLLRAALRGATEPETTLADEITLLRTYVAIEEMRFRDRLSVLIDVAPETEQALVPGFLLQPLVENAIVHGLSGSTSAGLIAITCTVKAENLVLRVTDNGRGVREGLDRKEGVGLGATRQRLERMYGPEHEFEISNLPEGGTEVRISIPYRVKFRSDESMHEHPALTHR